jgi:hypothetical protein
MPENVAVERIVDGVASHIIQASGQKSSNLANIASVVFDVIEHIHFTFSQKH